MLHSGSSKIGWAVLSGAEKGCCLADTCCSINRAIPKHLDPGDDAAENRWHDTRPAVHVPAVLLGRVFAQQPRHPVYSSGNAVPLCVFATGQLSGPEGTKMRPCIVAEGREGSKTRSY